MPNITLDDLLQETEGFHRELSNHLTKASETHPDERAHLLLDYLAVHERDLEKKVKMLRLHASDTALNTWVSDYKEQFPPSSHDSLDQNFSAMNTEDIMQEVQEQHHRLISLYDHLQDFTTGSAGELVDQIVDLEQHEIKRLVQSSNRLEDI